MRVKDVFNWGVFLGAIAIGAMLITDAQAQRVRHHLVNSSMAPGTISRQAIMATPSLAEHIQPVQIVVPGTATVAAANGGVFTEAGSHQMLVGLGYGLEYRFKISNIHRQPGIDLYPSIEMVGRLHPPEGLATKHPIRVVLDQDDLKHAIAGRMITKVVYVENPETALPFQRAGGQQPYFDCGPAEDPFLSAEGLGRVMLIVRLGSRMPLTPDEFDRPQFGPAIQFFDQPSVEPTATQDTRAHRSFGVRHVSYEQGVDTPPVVSPRNASGLGRAMDQKAVKTQFRFTGSKRSVPTAEPLVPEINGTPKFAPYVTNTNRNAMPVTQEMECPTPLMPMAPAMVQTGDCCQCKESDIPRWVRDEWVCDGCDRDKRVSVDATSRVTGLGIEDTVAHFDTEEGETIVSASNRVCVYSPRFAAVRKVHSFSGASTLTKTGSIIDETKLERARGMDFDATTLQNLRLRSYQKEIRPSSFRDRTRGVVADNTIHLRANTGRLRAYENLQFIRFGRYENSEGSRLQLGIQSAIAWTDNLEAQMTVQNARAVVVDDKVKAKELVVVESDHHPKLRVCKIASRISANAGEIVEFTIRFDNVGQEIIHNVAVMDNLSPRLEFVEGSATCSVDADFDTEPNDAGSVRLRWRLTKSLEIKSGGFVRFQCRVR